ncbi:crop [Symbiodinium natans]|uniref:Crop protein n=1 Tax=Symbiodinium natans TaxID=878477 RepID=A0A812RAW2_9DINO|nr:crop [Symbiodinium natans]
MDATRALLDSLMGKDRNSGPDSKCRQSFKDPDVCKYYLVGDCPHEMWINQEGKASPNSPVGACKKQHSEAMRERLRADIDYVKYRWRYLEDLRVFLQQLVDDNNRKAQKVKEKLNEGVTCTADTHKVVEGHISKKESRAQEIMEAAEKMAEEGQVDASKQALEEADKLAHQKFRLTRLKEVADGWMDECCDVCGSQISWRAVEELEARSKGREHPHVPGAWHQGWRRCREALRKVTEEAQQAREACRGLDVGEVLDDAGGRGKYGERGRDTKQVRSRHRGNASRSRDGSPQKTKPTATSSSGARKRRGVTRKRDRRKGTSGSSRRGKRKSSVSRKGKERKRKSSS